MKTSPQITSVDPTIRIPAWRSDSPKNLNTRSPKISRKTCAMNFASSPKVSIQPLGVRISSLIYFGIVVISGWVASRVDVNA